MPEDPTKRWPQAEVMYGPFIEPPPRHPDFNWSAERERLTALMRESNNPHSVLEYILDFPDQHIEESYWEDFLLWAHEQSDTLLERGNSGVPDVADETVIALLNTAQFLGEYGHAKEADSLEEKVIAFWAENFKLFSVDGEAIPYRLGLRISSLAKMVYHTEMRDRLYKQITPRNRAIQTISHDLAFEAVKNGFTEEDRKDGNPLARVDLFDFENLILSTFNPNEIQELAEVLGERHSADLDLRTQRLHKASQQEKDRAHIVHLRRWIWSVMELEAHAPGTAKDLQSRFGIINFHHYPTEILKDIYDNRDNPVPYGVVVGAQYDWNDALHDAWDDHVLNSLYKQLKERGVHIRILEVDSARSLARRMLSLDKVYGSEHKMSFGMIRAHGGEEEVQLGNKYGQKLSKRQLKRVRPENLKRFFVEKPPIVVDSCSSGAPDGLAEEIATILGGVTYGAEGISYGVKEITVSGEAGHLKFAVELNEKSSKVEDESEPRLRTYNG